MSVEKRNNRLVFHVFMLVTITSLVIGLVYLAWSTYNYTTYEFRNLSKEGYIKVLSKDEVKNGGFVILDVSFKKGVDQDCPIKGTAVGLTRPEITLDNPIDRSGPGEHKAISVQKLPVFNTREPRYIEFELTCPLNPIRSKTTIIRTESFPIN